MSYVLHDTVPLLFTPEQRATVVVAATGPSLAHTKLDLVRERAAFTIAVSDAAHTISGGPALLPWADVLYSCDAKWWDAHHGAVGFAGRKFSSHSLPTNDKLACATRWGLELVHGAFEHDAGFSLDPARIHYGNNSGYQAVNLALLMGASKIVLVGFDMQKTKGAAHYFGEHQFKDYRGDPKRFIPAFNSAAAALQRQSVEVEIVNASETTALTCFPTMLLEEALCQHQLFV